MPRDERLEPKTIRLPVHLWARLALQAERDRRSVNNTIWVALEDWLDLRARGQEPS